MENLDPIKKMVQEKYGAIALEETQVVKASSCCGSCCSETEVYNIMNEEYDHLEGYAPEADLGLGCGLPTEFARIKSGDVVVDLGSGAGNDCFIARHETGPEGRVIGVDFTPAMLEKARQNAAKLGFSNVEFVEGDIDHLPLEDNLADVIVSNCVLNLVPNKEQVFKEIFRTLKPGGHFSISDIVLTGDLPEELRKEAEMYAGCVTGAIQKADYLGLIHQTGFQNLTLQKEKAIHIPDDILGRYLSPELLSEFKRSETGIFSITVFAQKPA